MRSLRSPKRLASLARPALPLIAAGLLGCGGESPDTPRDLELAVSKPTFASTTDMQLNAGAAIVTASGAPCGTGSTDCRLRLASPGAMFGRSSAFLKEMVGVQQFYVRARLTITGANPADGLTFTVHAAPAGAAALGGTGGGLGSGPDPSFSNDPVRAASIPKSVSVKLDLYDNEGEGTNSTGVYLNGAKPTVPATPIGNGVDLHDGKPKDLKIVYGAGLLAVTITDVETGSSFNTKVPVDIPGTLGGTLGYAGFTAATGAVDSQVEILSMTANFGMPAARYSFEYGKPAAFAAFGDVGVSDEADTGIAPTLGSKLLEVGTFCPVGCSAGASNEQLAAFVGVGSDALDQVSGGEVYEGSAVAYTLTAAAGDMVRFDWNFTTEEKESAGWNDVAFVGVGTSLQKLASTYDATTPGGLSWQTGWRTFTHIFTTAGTYKITFGAADVTDGSANSALLIDNFRVYR